MDGGEGTAATRVRLRDVARHAGVAPATASTVLNGRAVESRIAPATQQRVRAAAAELGYRPNLAALSLRSRTSRIVGLVSDSIAAAPYAGEMVRGASASAVTHGRLLVIAETDGSHSVEDDLVNGMIDRQVDGLLYGCLATRTVMLTDTVRSLPVVLLNCLADPLPGPAVVPDEVEAGGEAARALLDAGHRTGIWVIGRRHRDVLAGRRRLRGIRARLAEAGCRARGHGRLRLDAGRRPRCRRTAAAPRAARRVDLPERPDRVRRLPGARPGRAADPRRRVGGLVRRLGGGRVVATRV